MFDNAINGKGQWDGYTIGTDCASSVDHLFSHVDENYLHGSLMVNAMRATGHNDAAIGTRYQMNLRSTFKRALRRYLLRSFGLAAKVSIYNAYRHAYMFIRETTQHSEGKTS